MPVLEEFACAGSPFPLPNFLHCFLSLKETLLKGDYKNTTLQDKNKAQELNVPQLENKDCSNFFKSSILEFNF